MTSPPLSHHLSKAAGGVFLVSALNQLLTLIILMTLTRLASPDQFGIFSVTMAILTVAAIPFRGGFPLYATHHVSSGDPASVQGLIRRWRWFVPLTAFLVGALLALSFWLTHNAAQSSPMMFAPLYLAANACVMLNGAFQRGHFSLVRGRITELLLQPTLLIVFLLCLCLVGALISASAIMALQSSAMLVAALMAIALTRETIPPSTTTPTYHDKEWLQGMVPMMVGMALITINAAIDVVMVGYLIGEEQAGPYRLAAQLATFITFFLAVTNNATQPLVSRLYKEKKFDELQALLTRTARWTFCFSLPPGLLMIFFPSFLLGLFFGEAYTSAASSLIILAGVALLNIGSGQAAQLLLLTGHGREVSSVVAIAIAINLALNLLLVPMLGMPGAAIATSISIICWKGYVSYRAYQLTGLGTSIFARTARHTDTGKQKEANERTTPSQL